MTLQNPTKKTVMAGLFMAMGIILPFVTAHGFGMSGNVILPMHIPVLLCGFICGPLYGAFCGLALPVINSLLTGMPTMFPMAVIMTGELTTYGLVSGLLNEKFGKSHKVYVLYILLGASMAAGRIVYGISAGALLLAGANGAKLSVLTAIVTGIPGIVIQLILVPVIVKRITKPALGDMRKKAIEMVKNGSATCVTLRNGKIETQGNPRGIAYIIDLYEKDMLRDAFVADKIVGKAAAMVFTRGDVSSCYAQNISDGAVEWLESHHIPVEYANRSPHIINRTGDGICPMELTVAHIENEKEAISALKKKIEELKNSKRER